MLRNLVLILILAVLPISLFAQPKLEIVGGETKNWGKVTLKESPLKYNMVIKNKGNKMLKITKLKATCGCTTAPLKKDSLAPGESTTVEVSLSIQGNSGPIHKQIAVESNDPEKPYINYMLIAELVLPLTVSPTSYLPFNNLRVGVETESKLKIKNTSEGNITFTNVKTNIPDIKVNLQNNQVLKPGQEVELIAKIRPSKVGNLSAKITVETNNKEIPELIINGFGKVEPSPFFNN